MNLASNNNRNVVSHLAKSSVKTNKLRNFFAVFAIVLSVSLLTVMGLFVSGQEMAESRLVAKMQQVIYMEIEEAQAKKMAEEEDVSYLKLMKDGAGVEVGSRIVQPMWYDGNVVKGDKEEVQFTKVEKGGRMPETMEEAAVPEEYCKLLGVEAKIGNTIKFAAVDGTEEEFVITGFLDGDWDNSGILSVLFSREYAQKGKLLKDTPYLALVNLKNGNKMTQDEFQDRIVELGKKYGVARKNVNPNNYFTGTLKGDPVREQQRIVVVGICIGILFVSILVIYSVFYLSVIGRIRQFGQLRTIGMTKKQIRRMVTREGLILSGIGIPTGLLTGSIIGYFIKKDGWDWMRTLVIFAVVVVADVMTVWLSIYKPAKLAAGISPIEAAKFTGEISEKKSKKGKKNKTKEMKKLQRSLSPSGLAKISATKNQKKTFLTVLSLGVGGVLFMLAATFITSTSLEEYSRQGAFQKGAFLLTLSSNAAETDEHGLSGLMMNNPLDKELKDRILDIKGTEKIYQYQKMEMKWEAHDEGETDAVHPVSKEEFERVKNKWAEKDSPLRDKPYEEMVENQEIFISGNNTVKEVFGWEFEPGDKVRMTFDNGKEIIEKEYTVAGIVDSWRYMKEEIDIGWFCMPEALVKEVSGELNLNDSFVVKTDGSRQIAIENEISSILEEHPSLRMYTLRERKLEDEKSFALVYIIILGLSGFIIGFSMLNLINTLITNVVTRKQEFAMLESVGMSRKQLNRMVILEGLILSGGNAVITLVIGSLAGFAGIQFMREIAATYMHYHFPVWFYLGYLAVLIVVPVLVSGIVLRGFEKQALTERLKVED